MNNRFTTKDRCMLFGSLPFDVDIDSLPILIDHNIYLEEFPFQIINNTYDNNPDKMEIHANIDYIVPGYKSIINYENYCLKNSNKTNYYSNNYLFLIVAALRYIKPLKIHITSIFEYDNEDFPISQATLYWLTSPWSYTQTNVFYTKEDIEPCKRILNRILSINNDKLDNIMSAIILFNQATIGFTLSYQMLYLTLFAALEAIYDPKEKKARHLSRRASSYLQNVISQFDVEKFIYDEYTSERNIIHGKQEIDSIFSNINREKLDNISKLMEIVRLSILGFLNMDYNDLKSFGSITKGSKNTILNNLPKINKQGICGNIKAWL